MTHRSGVLALLVGASVIVASCGGSGSAPTTSSTTTTAPGPARPSVLVGVTSAGQLDRLNPATGAVEQTLDVGPVVGDEVSVSPDGSTVYFEEKSGCDDQIWSVGINGANPTLVVDQGSLPTVSASAVGDELAYAVQPL